MAKAPFLRRSATVGATLSSSDASGKSHFNLQSTARILSTLAIKLVLVLMVVFSNRNGKLHGELT